METWKILVHDHIAWNDKNLLAWTWKETSAIHVSHVRVQTGDKGHWHRWLMPGTSHIFLTHRTGNHGSVDVVWLELNHEFRGWVLTDDVRHRLERRALSTQWIRLKNETTKWLDRRPAEHFLAGITIPKNISRDIPTISSFLEEMFDIEIVSEETWKRWAGIRSEE